MRAIIQQIIYGGGSPPSDATPAANSWGQSGSAGSSSEVSRADHRHAMPSNPGGGGGGSGVEVEIDRITLSGGETLYDFNIDSTDAHELILHYDVPPIAPGSWDWLHWHVNEDYEATHYQVSGIGSFPAIINLDPSHSFSSGITRFFWRGGRVCAITDAVNGPSGNVAGGQLYSAKVDAPAAEITKLRIEVHGIVFPAGTTFILTKKV